MMASWGTGGHTTSEPNWKLDRGVSCDTHVHNSISCPRCKLHALCHRWRCTIVTAWHSSEIYHLMHLEEAARPVNVQLVQVRPDRVGVRPEQ